MKQILTIIMVMFCVTASAQKTVVAVYAANMGKCDSLILEPIRTPWPYHIPWGL